MSDKQHGSPVSEWLPAVEGRSGPRCLTACPPASAPVVARELAAGIDDRIRALGERVAASPQPWLARQLGALASSASPALLAEYTRRAGLAAAYREAAGITNPDQAVALEPHRCNPDLENMRKTGIYCAGDPQ